MFRFQTIGECSGGHRFAFRRSIVRFGKCSGMAFSSWSSVLPSPRISAVLGERNADGPISPCPSAEIDRQTRRTSSSSRIGPRVNRTPIVVSSASSAQSVASSSGTGRSWSSAYDAADDHRRHFADAVAEHQLGPRRRAGRRPHRAGESGRAPCRRSGPRRPGTIRGSTAPAPRCARRGRRPGAACRRRPRRPRSRFAARPARRAGGRAARRSARGWRRRSPGTRGPSG